MALAMTGGSLVTASLVATPTSAASISMQLTPENVGIQIPDSGGIAVTKQTITVTTEGVAGYTVQVNSANANSDLTMGDTNKVIKAQSTTPNGGFVKPSKLLDNEWGMAIPGYRDSNGEVGYGSTSDYEYGSQEILKDLLFASMPPLSSSGGGSVMNTDVNTSGKQSIYFGARVDDPSQIMSGSYTGSIVYTATAKLPLKPAIIGVSKDNYTLGDKAVQLAQQEDDAMGPSVLMKSGSIWINIANDYYIEKLPIPSSICWFGKSYNTFVAKTCANHVVWWGDAIADGSSVSVSAPIVLDNLLGGDVDNIRISLGGGAVIAVTANEKVYTWGESSLTNNYSGDKSVPIDVTSAFNLTDDRIIDASIHGKAGGIAVTNKGRVFQWGSIFTSNPPAVVDGFALGEDEMVTEVAIGSSVTSGQRHFLALTNRGKLFSWGNNRNGAVGNGGSESSVDNPIDITGKLNLKNGENVIQIYSPLKDVSMVVTNLGRTFIWGSGRGIASEEHANNLPYDITDLVGGRVVDVSSGRGTYILREDGAIFATSNFSNDLSKKLVESPVAAISGSNFATNSTVFIDLNSDGIAQDNELCTDIKVTNDTEITCNVPTDENITPGMYNLYVQTDDIKSDPVEFKYERIE